LISRIGFGKLGNIGCAPLLEFLLDERAERNDIEVRAVGSGAKMGVEQASEVAQAILEFKPDLAVVTSPNCTLPGPSRLRELLSKVAPTIIISDSPGKKAVQDIEKIGAGYLIAEADSMIGARREYLDPTEMALFNADILKVLSVTGVLNVIWQELDRVITTINRKEPTVLPRIVISKEKAIESSQLTNPYAIAKALAAHEIAKRVSDLTFEACFVVKDWEHYTKLASAAHEMMRDAARLVDEAREIEKAQDSVIRTPHQTDGQVLTKQKLIEKPKKPEET
jgi:methylenetetrahydromethanopterin dehydrogenase